MENKEVLCLGLFFTILSIFAQCHLAEAGRIEKIRSDLDINEILKDFPGSVPSLRREKRSLPKEDATCIQQERTLLSNIHNTKITDSYRFQNVSTYRYHYLNLIWTGKNDGVILLIARGYSASLVFRSVDGGKTFNNITDTIPVQIHSDEGVQMNANNHQNVYIGGKSLSDRNTVVVAGAALDVLYVTTDGGMTFKPYPLEAMLDNPFIFNPSENCSQCFMYIDSYATLHVTWNNAQNWTTVAKDVTRAKWGYDPRTDEKKKTTGKTIYITVKTGKRKSTSSYLPSYWRQTEVEFHDLMKADDGATFSTILSSVIGFGEMNGYLYASVFEDVDEKDAMKTNRYLKTSSKNGDKGTWFDAQVPSITPDQFYSVIEMDENVIFLHVDNPGRGQHGTLYISEVNSIVFTESLQRHLGSEDSGLTDFYKVQSMRGVYISSQLKTNGAIQTVITYNRGATWQTIPAPDGVKCENDDSTGCSLQLYMNYMASRYMYGELPLSENSALGIIMAHGHVADSYKNDRPDVYISNDGGYSWNWALEGPHKYMIADSGGVLAAVSVNSTYAPMQTIKFSTDEGRCWHEYNFTDTHFVPKGVFAEPGAKTLNVSVWGIEGEHYPDRNWQTYVIDFLTVCHRKCLPSDYVTWTPHSKHRASEAKDVQGCLFGQREEFLRLKKDSWCYNGYEHEKAGKVTLCNCTREDYDCDYGYERQWNSDECVEVFKSKDIHICFRGHEEKIVSQGYIKIPGDKCVGGLQTQSKMINLTQLCEDYSKIYVIKDLKPANDTNSTISAGNSTSSSSKAAEGKDHKLAIVAVVSVVLTVAVVIAVFSIYKVCKSKKQKEQRYTLLNHTDEDEYDADDVSQPPTSSRLAMRSDVQEGRPTGTDEAIVVARPGQNPKENQAGYHDDSDDDMLMT